MESAHKNVIRLLDGSLGSIGGARGMGSRRARAAWEARGRVQGRGREHERILRRTRKREGVRKRARGLRLCFLRRRRLVARRSGVEAIRIASLSKFQCLHFYSRISCKFWYSLTVYF